MYASMNGHADCLQLLIAAEVNLEIKDNVREKECVHPCVANLVVSSCEGVMSLYLFD